YHNAALSAAHTRGVSFFNLQGGNFEAFRMALAHANCAHRNGPRDRWRRVRAFVVARCGSLCLSELLWTAAADRQSVCRSRNVGRGHDKTTRDYLSGNGPGGRFLWLI